MAPAPYRAEPGNWFLRGVQSAVFYYISLTPCLEFQHKRKRRREAKATKSTEVVTTQPGIIRQPGPFQTNEAWAEEIMLGPGPPKGWKADTLRRKVQKKSSAEQQDGDTLPPSPTLPELYPPPTASTTASTLSTTLSTEPLPNTDTEAVDTDATGDPSSSTQKTETAPTRPPAQRRMSNAMENIKDNLKDSFRATLHPPKWNWKRYDREDEILGGFTEKVSRMWNRATAVAHQQDKGEGSQSGRKRADTTESDRYDYYRARNPEVNDLHPPVVSQLPATRAHAAWMLLPPPSAAVMAGQKRPAAEPEMRRPLCVIGRLPDVVDVEPLEETTLTSQHVYAKDFANVSDTGADDADGDDESFESSDSKSTSTSSTIIPPQNKRFSDPFPKSDPEYSVRSPIAGDLFVPKRRDSWQVHYVKHIPSSPTPTPDVHW